MDIWDLKKEASDIKEEFRLTNNETVFKTKADQFIKKMISKIQVKSDSNDSLTRKIYSMDYSELFYIKREYKEKYDDPLSTRIFMRTLLHEYETVCEQEYQLHLKGTESTNIDVAKASQTFLDQRTLKLCEIVRKNHKSKQTEKNPSNKIEATVTVSSSTDQSEASRNASLSTVSNRDAKQPAKKKTKVSKGSMIVENEVSYEDQESKNATKEKKETK